LPQHTPQKNKNLKTKADCRIGDLEMNFHHQPVLLEQVLRLLNPQPGEIYFDGTAGLGGHAAAVISQIGPKGRAILVDRDSQALQQLEDRFGDEADLMHCNYLEAAERLLANAELVDMVLLDLGVSSPQLDIADRGFSFNRSGALDMRMDQSQPLTAAEVVNTYPQAELERIFSQYGEERRSKQVAKLIVQRRPFKTTDELAKVVRQAVGYSGKIDAATRTFQAIRVEVNAELSSLTEALPKLVELLSPGGRIAVIAFHSLEDRAVKEYFDRESRDCVCPPKQPVCTCNHLASLKKLTKGAVLGRIYDAHNPRARSAKLRAAAKINKNKRSQNDTSRQKPVSRRSPESASG
jgi:16S rRNA (cytosine1402-N4)-methyltransferase